MGICKLRSEVCIPGLVFSHFNVDRHSKTYNTATLSFESVFEKGQWEYQSNCQIELMFQIKCSLHQSIPDGWVSLQQSQSFGISFHNSIITVCHRLHRTTTMRNFCTRWKCRIPESCGLESEESTTMRCLYDSACLMCLLQSGKTWNALMPVDNPFKSVRLWVFSNLLGLITTS